MARYWHMTPAEVEAVPIDQYAAMREYMRIEAARANPPRSS